jgi:hypothetical protein
VVVSIIEAIGLGRSVKASFSIRAIDTRGFWRLWAISGLKTCHGTRLAGIFAGS